MASTSLVSAGISALIWLVISLATGGSALFSVGGAIVCGLVVFLIGYAFRLVVSRSRSL
ncbi:MAG TPA: hypothetical protein VHW26_11155 [Solirubrobacteraceae bacterium]|nr:hypothetical protein [Solirubrobacteraceae bacterium]